MPLGMAVGLSPGDFLLDGDPVPFPKRERNPGAEPPSFGPCLLWPNGAAWIKTPLGMEVGLSLRDIVFDVDPAIPRKRAHLPHPIFGPCLVAERLDG